LTHLIPLHTYEAIFKSQNAPNSNFSGSLQRSPDPIAGGRGSLSLPQNPFPRSRPFGTRTQHTHILFHSAAYGGYGFTLKRSSRVSIDIWYIPFNLITYTSDGNKTKMLRPRPRPRPIKQQQEYITKTLFCCNAHVCYQKLTLYRKCQKVIWWAVTFGTVSQFLHLLHKKIQVFITFQHYHVTHRLPGTTVLEARPKSIRPRPRPRPK